MTKLNKDNFRLLREMEELKDEVLRAQQDINRSESARDRLRKEIQDLDNENLSLDQVKKKKKNILSAEFFFFFKF